jgi:hypothetical protein
MGTHLYHIGVGAFAGATAAFVVEAEALKRLTAKMKTWGSILIDRITA